MSAEKPDPCAPKAATLLEAVVRDLASAGYDGALDVAFHTTPAVKKLPGRPDEPRIKALAQATKTHDDADRWIEAAHKLIHFLNEKFDAGLDPAALPNDREITPWRGDD